MSKSGYGTNKIFMIINRWLTRYFQGLEGGSKNIFGFDFRLCESFPTVILIIKRLLTPFFQGLEELEEIRI